MWTLLRKAYATQLHYPGNYLSFLVIQSLTQLLSLFYLVTVFSYTEQLKGWQRQEAIFVFYLAVIVVLCAECITCSIQQYYRKLLQGSLTPLLAMPLRNRSIQFIRWSEPGYLIPVLILLVCWPWIDPGSERPLLTWVTGGLAMLLGIGAIILVFSMASLPGLLTQRQAPADFMVSELSRMLFLPPSILPDGVWKLALGIGLPMLFSANAAAEILLKQQYSSIAALLSGVLILGFLHHRLERKLFQTFSYPGT